MATTAIAADLRKRQRRAAPAHAQLPLLELAGPDFVDLYTGTGARRARALFEVARKAAPCVVLIDRVEVVGKKVEPSDVDHSRREQDQAVNQLLLELEALSASHRVLMLATTSRPDELEPALSMPGRLDRRIELGAPDQKDREAILKVHAGKLTLEGAVDFARLAQALAGLQGAHVRELVDEAALIAALNQRTGVTEQDFRDALQKLHPARVAEAVA